MDILHKIHNVEDSYTQFKVDVTNAEKLSQEFVAFSNAKGGVLIIVVDDELEQFKCIIKREENKLGDNSIKLTKNRKLILKSIKDNNSITIAQLAQILNISTTAIENNLKYLKDNKLIERVGSDNAGSWKII